MLFTGRTEIGSQTGNSLAVAQTPSSDTLLVQADETYEADPDPATMTFQIFSQEKDLKRRAYDAATRSMQRIVDLSEKNNLRKDDEATGVITVAPIYDGDRKKRARSYYVQGQIVPYFVVSRTSVQSLTARWKMGLDFRSLAVAMRGAIGHTIGTERPQAGALRYMSQDLRQLYGGGATGVGAVAAERVEATAGGGGGFRVAATIPAAAAENYG